MRRTSRTQGLLSPLPVGIWLDFRDAPGSLPGPRTYAEQIALAEHAEREGFSFALVSEHHATADGYIPSPHLALAAIAARTRRLLVGGGVALAPLWPTRVLAEELSVLDLISGGRALAGLGLGYAHADYEAMGADRSRRGHTLDAQLRQLTAAWRDAQPLDDGHPLTPPPVGDGPPIVLGGWVPKALERAARHADVHFAAVRAGDSWRSFFRYRHRLAEACAAAGGDVPLAMVGTHVWVLEDDEQWEREIAPAIAYQRDAYLSIFDGEARRVPPAPPREDVIAGTVEEVARDLHELLDGGADCLCIWARPPGVSHSTAQRNVTRIAREALPLALAGR